MWQIDHTRKRKRLWLNARLIAATDPHLIWWLTKGPGKDCERQFVLHLCATPAGECWKTKRHREQEFHSDTSAGDIIAKGVRWFAGEDVKKDIEAEIAELEGAASTPEPGGRSRPGALKRGYLEWGEGDMAVEDDAPAGEEQNGQI